VSAVSDDYLAYLKSIDVSYILVAESEIDLGQVIAILVDELGTKASLIVETAPL
jgi:hypothetical protein